MEFLRNETNDQSFPMKKEMKTWSLNPDAQEFFPSRNTILFSAFNSPFSTPTDPYFLHYDPKFYLAPRFYYPFYPCILPPHATVPDHSLTQETVASVPPTVEQEHTDVARKRNTGGTRRRITDKCCLRNKRYHGRAKPSSISTVDKKTFARNFDHRCRVCNNNNHNNNNREKHPLISLKYDGNETTVMIKNIPNRYTREMLKEFLDEHCMIMNRDYYYGGTANEEPSISAYDFLYLPIDFYTKSNRGYAFVNFSNPRAARRFFDECHNKPWDKFHSTKIREICCAKLQGMEQLVKQFETMGFPCVEFQPLYFEPARDGSKQLVKETVIGRLYGFV